LVVFQDYEARLQGVAEMRSYGDPCGIARALDLVGERWALLIVRELLLGPKRFTDLRAGVPGASPNVLAQRLRELEQAGLVLRRKLGPPAGVQVYELTARGHDLEPILLELGRWGSRSPSRPAAELGVDALMLALKTTFDAGAARGLRSSYQLRLGNDCFRVVVADGRIDITRGSTEAPDVTLETDGATLRSLVFGRRRLTEVVRSGGLRFEGHRQTLERFFLLFPLPEPP
jgi:DNA-binding HxlR family transcriptional regulator/putative sterol carrier protein